MTDDMLNAWDELNQAIGAMLLAQPAQMSAAASRLELARKSYESLLMKAAFTPNK